MKTSMTSTGLDRINGLLVWWDVPHLIGVSGLEAQAKRFQIAIDLSKLFNEACTSQAQALSAANEQFAHALQELLSARQPPELMAAQLSLVTTLVESFAAQTKVWAELTQKLYDCYAPVVREADVGLGEHAIRSESVGKRGEAEWSVRRPDAKVGRQPKHLDHAAAEHRTTEMAPLF